MRPTGIAKQSATTEFDIAVSFGGAGLSWRRAKWTPCAVDTAVAMPADEVRPPESQSGVLRQNPISQCLLGEAGSYWPRANDVDSAAAATTAIKPAGESRLPEVAKHSATTKPELAESSSGAGPSWTKASGMNSAAATAAIKPVGEARPPGIVKQRATTKPELAKSSGRIRAF